MLPQAVTQAKSQRQGGRDPLLRFDFNERTWRRLAFILADHSEIIYFIVRNCDLIEFNFPKLSQKTVPLPFETKFWTSEKLSICTGAMPLKRRESC